MNLPSEVRKALGLKGSGHVVITMDDGTMTMRTKAQAPEQVRVLARPYAPKDRLVSDEAIVVRRQRAHDRLDALRVCKSIEPAQECH